jgi:hypothetical protein
MQRTLLALSLTISQLPAVELKVDHVTVAGRDLSQLQQMFAGAGVPVEYGGKHSNGITEMALSSFADGSYLELIAPQAGADVTPHYWGRFMMEQSGPCAWAVTTKDLPGDLKRLQAAGVEVHPTKSGRKRPDGVELKWEASNVGPGPQGSFFPFLIQDETPREHRVYPQGKPTTSAISGVRYVVVTVADLSGAVAKYRAAFGLGEPETQVDASLGARLAWFPGTPAVLAEPQGAGSWLAGRLKQFGEIPCAFVLGSRSPRSFSTASPVKWFSGTVAWLDGKKLAGMRIGISQE